MALTSTSTIADAKAQYFASLSYETDGTGGLARDFVAACRYLRVALPQMSGTRGTSLSLDLTQLAQLEEQALRWLSARGLSSGNVPDCGNVVFGFGDYRA